MSWEQHRYAVERARERLKDRLDAVENVESQFGGVSLQGEAARSDVEMLDDVADFLKALEGPKTHDPMPVTFIKDWNKTVARIAEFSAQYGLPAPDMIFNPIWRTRMDDAAGKISPQILGTLIYMGVRVRFGQFVQADVLHQL